MDASTVAKQDRRVEFEEDEPEPGVGFCGGILIFFSVILIICSFPISIFMCIKIVAEYERAVIFRLGRIVSGRPKGPGLFFIIPCVDTMRKVDLRTIMFDIRPQEILTRDSVTVTVDAVVYYRIFSPIMSVKNVADVDSSTRFLAQTTLRNVLGTKNLSDILSEREAVSQAMLAQLDEATDPWGVKVERVEVKDVRLPTQMQRAMAAEAEANREANAKARKRPLVSLKEASDIMAESPAAALQLRYLQTLNTISAEKNSTVIFPLPMEIMSFFVDNKKTKM
uniref:PHB domain-containing protein n=1 Tax=Macrostomum lignano TaxID=282301 RepID=A0A1I8HN38_9PLAT